MCRSLGSALKMPRPTLPTVAALACIMALPAPSNASTRSDLPWVSVTNRTAGVGLQVADDAAQDRARDSSVTTTSLEGKRPLSSVAAGGRHPHLEISLNIQPQDTVFNIGNASDIESPLTSESDQPYAHFRIAQVRGQHDGSSWAIPPSATRTTPGFDCNEARKETELAICRSDALSQLDATLSDLYSKAMRNKNDVDGDELRKEQIRWLLSRNRCKDDILCISAIYKTRIMELRALIAAN